MLDKDKISRYVSLAEQFDLTKPDDSPEKQEMNALEESMSIEERFDAYYQLGIIDDEDLQSPDFEGKSKAEIIEIYEDLISTLSKQVSEISDGVTELNNNIRQTIATICIEQYEADPATPPTTKTLQ